MEPLITSEKHIFSVIPSDGLLLTLMAVGQVPVQVRKSWLLPCEAITAAAAMSAKLTAMIMTVTTLRTNKKYFRFLNRIQVRITPTKGKVIGTGSYPDQDPLQDPQEASVINFLLSVITEQDQGFLRWSRYARRQKACKSQPEIGNRVDQLHALPAMVTSRMHPNEQTFWEA
jgi:hypothetical protein